MNVCIDTSVQMVDRNTRRDCCFRKDSLCAQKINKTKRQIPMGILNIHLEGKKQKKSVLISK